VNNLKVLLGLSEVGSDCVKVWGMWFDLWDFALIFENAWGPGDNYAQFS